MTLLPLPLLSDLPITVEKPSFLAFSRTHSNKSFCVANFCLVVKYSRWSIQTTTTGGGTTGGIGGGGASYTFEPPKQISSFGGGGGGFSDLAFSESCASSSKRSGNTIRGSFWGGSSFGALTGTIMTENSAKQS